MRMTSSVAIKIILWLAGVAPAGAQANVKITTATPILLTGDAPEITLTGLEPGELITVHSFRRANTYTTGTFTPTPVVAEAQAVFRASPKGTVSIAKATALSGTYTGVDALGLLWSGVAMTESEKASAITQGIKLASANDVLIRAEAPSLGTGAFVETTLTLTDGAADVALQTVSEPGLNGAFARPNNVPAGKALPAILLLHGSEGGSPAGAKELAIRFAHLGYAAFAVNYFLWSYSGVTAPGVPQALANVPVEALDTARAWLQRQPGVDASRLAVWGVSKGAELALVAAANRPYIDRVIACVPSSVVWSGFGRDPAPGETLSSWSVAGKPLPFIPYDHYEDVMAYKISAAGVHRRSLEKATPAEIAAATIPIERSNARFLLFAATRDNVWNSAPMTRQIEDRMRRLDKSSQLQTVIFDDAAHYICGTGAEMTRVNPVHNPEGNDPSSEATAHATARTWALTRAFLQHP